MATLATVQDYVTAARVLLNDTDPDYRYSDDDLLLALNLGLLEARKLRADLFLGRTDAVPSFAAVNTTAVDFDPQYRVALLYYIVGYTQLIDEEDTQDARAASFINMFKQALVVLG